MSDRKQTGARRVPKRLRDLPNPADLRVVTEEFTGVNRATARAHGGRRSGYGQRARLREVTPTEARAMERRQDRRLAKVMRRLSRWQAAA